MSPSVKEPIGLGYPVQLCCFSKSVVSVDSRDSRGQDRRASVQPGVGPSASLASFLHLQNPIRGQVWLAMSFMLPSASSHDSERKDQLTAPEPAGL